MCFSATASFVTGTVLGLTGVAALSQISKKNELPLAAIPFLFGVQQLTEGFVWLSLTNPAYADAGPPAATLFLIFAQVLWPFWVPYSMLLAEKEEFRRKVLFVIMGIGTLVSLGLGQKILNGYPMAIIDGSHLYYDLGPRQENYHYFNVFYFIATVFSPFASGYKRMWMLGILTFISFMASIIFFEEVLISVWCFFAAIISIVVYMILREQKKKPFIVL